MDEVKEFEDYLKGAFKRIHADKKEYKIEFVVRLAENENKIYEKQTIDVIRKILKGEL